MTGHIDGSRRVCDGAEGHCLPPSITHPILEPPPCLFKAFLARRVCDGAEGHCLPPSITHPFLEPSPCVFKNIPGPVLAVPPSVTNSHTHAAKECRSPVGNPVHAGAAQLTEWVFFLSSEDSSRALLETAIWVSE